MSNFKTLLTGSIGIGLMETVENVHIPDVTENSGLVSVLIQIVIGVVTLIKLLKKKKEV